MFVQSKAFESNWKKTKRRLYGRHERLWRNFFMYRYKKTRQTYTTLVKGVLRLLYYWIEESQRKSKAINNSKLFWTMSFVIMKWWMKEYLINRFDIEVIIMLIHKRISYPLAVDYYYFWTSWKCAVISPWSKFNDTWIRYWESLIALLSISLSLCP